MLRHPDSLERWRMGGVVCACEGAAVSARWGGMRSAPKSLSSHRQPVAQELRPQLEAARLDLRALYRALDRMLLARQRPPELHRLQELDADFAEALWVFDQPSGNYDWSLVRRDTLASLEALPRVREQFLVLFDGSTRVRLEERVKAMRAVLSPEDAYLEVPGRDPAAL